MSAGRTSARSEEAPETDGTETGGRPSAAPTRPVRADPASTVRETSRSRPADPATAPVVRLGNRPTLPLALTVAVGVFLVAAIVKPWGSPSRGGDTATGSPLTQAGPPIASGLPEPSAEILGAAATSCLSSDRQQLVVFERWPGNEVRSWIAVPDVAASGPLDRALVSTDVFAAHAVAIGVCAPSIGGSATRRHAATILDVRVVLAGAGGGQPLDAGAPGEVAGGGDGPDPIRLFGPPPAAATSPEEPAARPSTAASSPAAGVAASASTATARGGTSSPGSATGSASSPGPSAATTRSSSSAPAAAGAAGSPGLSPSTDGAGGGTSATTPVLDTWALGAYTIAFRYSFDPPEMQRWLRFALLRGGGDG